MLLSALQHYALGGPFDMHLLSLQDARPHYRRTSQYTAMSVHGYGKNDPGPVTATPAPHPRAVCNQANSIAPGIIVQLHRRFIVRAGSDVVQRELEQGRGLHLAYLHTRALLLLALGAVLLHDSPQVHACLRAGSYESAITATAYRRPRMLDSDCLAGRQQGRVCLQK